MRSNSRAGSRFRRFGEGGQAAGVRDALASACRPLACVVLVWSAWAGSSPASAQPTVDADRQWVHRHWTVEDGLPVDVLTGVAQDEDGYLWIGTYDGLVRFDGVRFVTLRPAQEPALASPRVIDVIRHGRCIWFRTTGGLTRFRNGMLESVVPEDPADGSFVALVSRGGRLWALADHALYAVDEAGEVERVEVLPADVGLLDVLVDGAGRRWLLTSAGIAWSEASELRRHAIDDLFSGAVETERGLVFFRQDRSPLMFRDGEWVASDDPLVRGVSLLGTSGVMEAPWGDQYLINGGRTLRVGPDGSEVLDRETSTFLIKPGFAIEDEQGGRWTALGGAVERNGETVLRVATGTDAQVLARDRDGTVWVATSGDGLYAIRPATVRMIDEAEGLESTNVYGVFEDRSGAMWAATLGGGVWRRESAAWRPVPVAGREGEPVFARSFLERRDGSIWVGLLGGPSVWDGRRLRRVDEPGAPRVRVNSMVEDDAGELWVGTADGLYRREQTPRGPSWREVFVDGDSLGEVRSLLRSPAGTLWVAGVEGLARFDGTRWTRARRGNGSLPGPQRDEVPAGTMQRTDLLPTDLLRSLMLDDDGVLWAGTDDAGLLRIEWPQGAPTPSVLTIGPELGLETTNVHHVLQDDFGFLWLSSNRGLFRVDRREIDAVRSGRRERIRAVWFDELDGMNDREGNGGTSNAGLQTAEGRMWFATQAGIAVVDPRDLQALRTGAVPTIVEGVRVDSRLEPASGDLRLAADERTFSVEYTALAPAVAHRAHFRYRMVGLVDEWRDVGERREAFFTKVPAGNYRFEVETLGVSGLLEGSSASLAITVQPRVWETTWFRTLALLLLLGVLVALFQWRDLHQRRARRHLEEIVRDRTLVIQEQAERLRRLDRVKSDLFTDVSHEFRTPLTLTIGPLQDLLDGVRGDLDAGARDEVELALRNARRLLDLINQILDVARMEAGQVRLAREPLAVDGFLEDRVANFASLATHEGVSLEVRVDPPLDDPAPGDPTPDISAQDSAGRTYLAAVDRGRLGRAVDNLVLNALQWTPAGGSVEVGLRRVQGASGPDTLEISVRDTGPGIAAEDLERIFLRFQRGAEDDAGFGVTAGGVETTSAQAQRRSDGSAHRWSGTGIGLAQTREIARLHGGDLKVESTEGEGTVFRIVLPMAAAGAESRAERAEPSATEEPDSANIDRRETDRDAASRNDREAASRAADPDESEADGRLDDRPLILVADDDPEIRAYLQRTLESTYRVHVASDGDEALAAARDQVPDVLVCDVMMPRMDGLAVVRAFHADPELDFVPIVLLTARGADEVRLEALDLGVDDYLVKPFLRRELLSRIRNLLTRRAQWSASAADRPLPLRVTLPEFEPPESADAEFLRQVLEVVEEGLSDPDLTVEELATRVGCDRTVLFRRLKDQVGESPSALLRRLRLERAETLLRARAGNVSEIAYGVGFRSVSHFTKSFRAAFEMTPSAAAARGAVAEGDSGIEERN